MKFRSLTIVVVLASLANFASAQIPYRTNEGWQLVNAANRKPVLPMVFEELRVLDDDRLRVKHNGLTGIIKTDGTWIIKPEYEEIEIIGKYYAFTASGHKDVIQGETVDGLWGIMDANAQVIVKPAYHQVEYGNETMFIVQVEENWGKWGIIDLEGNWIEKPVYPSVSFDMRPFSSIHVVGPHHMIYDNEHSGLCEFKDLKTKKVKKIKHESLRSPWFEDGKAVFYNEKGASLVKYDGSVIIPAISGEMVCESDFVFVFQKEKTLFYNNAGKLIKTFQPYKEVEWKGNYGLLKGDDKYLVIDTNGNEIKRTYGSRLELILHDFITQQTSTDKQLIINLKSGAEMLVPEFYKAESYNPESGLSVLKDTSGQFFIYDFKSVKFTASGFYDMGYWKENLYIAAMTYNVVAVINGKTGEKFYKFKPAFEIKNWSDKYSIYDPFSGYVYKDAFDEVKRVATNDSLYIVRMKNDYHIVNAVQHKMSAPYSSIQYLGGNFIVNSNKKSGLVNLEMKEMVPCTMNEIKLTPCGGNYFYRLKNNLYGLADSQGKMILDTVNSVIEDRGNLVVFKSNSEYGFIDSKGKRVQGLDGTSYFYFANISDWIVCSLPGKSVLMQVSTQKIIEIPDGSFLERGVKIDGLPAHFYLRNSKYDYGIMDDNGKVIVPAGKYDNISLEASPVQFMSSKDHAVILDNENGKLALSRVDDFKMVQLGYQGEVSKPFMYALKKASNVYVLVDKDLKPAGDKKYLDLEQAEHVIVAKDLQGKYGAVNDLGQEVIPFVYEGFNEDVWQYTAMKKEMKYHLFDQYHQRVFTDLKIVDIEYSLADVDDRYITFSTADMNLLVDVSVNSIVLENFNSVEYDEEIFYMNYIDSMDHYESADVVIVNTMDGKGLYSLRALKYLIEPNNRKLEIMSFDPAESYFIKVEKMGKYNLYDLAIQKFLFKTGMDEITKSDRDDVVKAIKGDSLYVLAADFDHPAFKVIRIEKQYKKAEFSQDYDFMIGDEPVLTVKYKGKKGLLRKDGIWIHKPELESFDYYLYNDKYLIVTKKGLSYIIDLEGKYITQKGFDVIEFIGDGGDMAHGYIGSETYRIGEDGEVKLITEEE